MVVYGRDRSERIHWYAPGSASDDAVALLPDRVDEPLDWSTRLEVKHAPGRYEITARFFDGPMPAERAAQPDAGPVYELHTTMEIYHDQ